MELMGVKTNKLIAEFIGTFLLVFAVLASVNGLFGSIPTPVVAGFSVFLSVLTVGLVSGTHLNPAVTVALFSLKKIDLTSTIAYIVVQLLAGLVALMAIDMVLGNTSAISLSGGGMWNTEVIVAEAFGAAVLLFGIAAAIKNKFEGGTQAGLIGGSVTLGAFFAVVAGSLGAINPAVAIGLGVFNASYIIGPILGAVIGANLYMYVVASGKK